MKRLSASQILKKYGQPGDPDNLVVITSPFPFKIAWDKKKTITRLMCHKLIADNLLAALNEILAVYGDKKIDELGINLFGGLNNFRPKRGFEKKYEAAIKAKRFAEAYTYLSTHAWAISLDIDPERNGNKTPFSRSQFSKPEYKPMLDIFNKYGFINYGQVIGRDAMHFEAT